VHLATRVLRVSDSGYYEWRVRAPSARSVRQAWLGGQINAVHTVSRGTYGARRVSFRMWLVTRDVYVHRSGPKRVHHPVVGEVCLSFEGMRLAQDEGLSVVTYIAEPGSPSEDALRLLASWPAGAQDLAVSNGTGGGTRVGKPRCLRLVSRSSRGRFPWLRARRSWW